MNAPLENVSVPPSAPRVRDDLISPDPLLDCLIEVARLHGQAATRASLSAGLPLQPQEPLPLSLVERAAARAGLATRVQRLGLGTAALLGSTIWHMAISIALTGFFSVGSTAVAITRPISALRRRPRTGVVWSISRETLRGRSSVSTTPCTKRVCASRGDTSSACSVRCRASAAVAPSGTGLLSSRERA